MKSNLKKDHQTHILPADDRQEKTYDFESISIGLDNDHNFNCIFGGEKEGPPQLPKLENHLIEDAGAYFDAGEYHNSNIERNFGNTLLNELNDHLSDFSLTNVGINQHEDTDFFDYRPKYVPAKTVRDQVYPTLGQNCATPRKKEQNFICTEVVGHDPNTGEP